MKEADIRPKALLERYQELSLRDAQTMKFSEFMAVPCPACGSESHLPKFMKNRFRYVQCQDCGSVYCSPRPDRETLGDFYRSSESSTYWATVFFPAVAEARREKLFRKKALQIAEIIGIGSKEEIAICDVGAGYGIFLEELRGVFPWASMYAIEPSPELAAVCKDKGFTTLVAEGEEAGEWNHRFDLVISSEVIEHVFSPVEFVESLYRLTRPMGKVLLTGLGYEGFDILMLQDKSNSVFPPHHLNFLSISGFERLLGRAGFREVDVWTPGLLDVDIVMNSGHVPEFLEVLAKREGALSDLQDLLARYKLSSHVWATGTR